MPVVEEGVGDSDLDRGGEVGVIEHHDRGPPPSSKSTRFTDAAASAATRVPAKGEPGAGLLVMSVLAHHHAVGRYVLGDA